MQNLHLLCIDKACCDRNTGGNLHARSTSSHFPAFFQAVKLPPSVRLRLTHHVIVIVGFAPGSDEVGCAHQGCRTCPDFCHFGDVVGEGCSVQKDLLIEPDCNVSNVDSEEFG